MPRGRWKVADGLAIGHRDSHARLARLIPRAGHAGSWGKWLGQASHMAELLTEMLRCVEMCGHGMTQAWGGINRGSVISAHDAYCPTLWVVVCMATCVAYALSMSAQIS